MQRARLLDVVRDRIRVKHYSYRTEASYLGWIRRFIRFHAGRHPREMGGPEVEGFLTYLAKERKVAASTQNQALSAILFLYRQPASRSRRHVTPSGTPSPRTCSSPATTSAQCRSCSVTRTFPRR